MRIGFDFAFDFFNPLGYFLDLLILSIVLVPAFRFVRNGTGRKALLTLTGAYLIFLVAPRLFLFYAGFWLWVAMGVLLLRGLPAASATRSIVFWIFLTTILSPLLLWKWRPEPFVVGLNLRLHDVLGALDGRLAEIDFIRTVFIPVGLSMAVFRAVDLLVQVRIGALTSLTTLDVLCFGFFPPALLVGPLFEYRDLESAPADGPKAADIVVGLQRVLIGFTKVLVLAWPLQFTLIVIRHAEAYRSPYVLLCLILFGWSFYLNFSGYSDLALGCARLYGFRLTENFNLPFFQPDLQKFWSSWHMSLTRFAQRNVFVPLGGFRKKRQYPALMATMLVIALWHDLSLPLLLFGLYHGAALCVLRARAGRGGLERWVPHPQLARAVSTGLTFLFVVASFPLIVLPAGRLLPFYRALLP